MREILFKGNRIDNGKLIYGFYVRELCGKHYIMMDDGFKYDGKSMLSEIEIDYKTLSQYTGIKDMKRNKIFENDTVTVYERDKLCNMYGEEGLTGKVKFIESGYSVVLTENDHNFIQKISNNNKNHNLVKKS